MAIHPTARILTVSKSLDGWWWPFPEDWVWLILLAWPWQILITSIPRFHSAKTPNGAGNGHFLSVEPASVKKSRTMAKTTGSTDSPSLWGSGKPMKTPAIAGRFFLLSWMGKNTLHHVTSSNPGPDNLFKHSCWYIIWNHMFHIYSEILPGIYSDILFWQKIRRSFWHKPRHSIWHSIWIYLAYYTLTFYLIFSGNLSEILNILWHFIWHSFSHSQACTRVVRHIFIHFIWHYFLLSIWHRFWILI